MALGHRTCFDCKKKSPQTELDYSLLGLAGWRELRTKDAQGAEVVQWRCPACWAEHKKRTRARTQVNLPSLDSIPKKRPPG